MSLPRSFLSTNHRPVSAYLFDSGEEKVSCDDVNNCRTLFSITSGCLATLFLSTWVSIHPNVPPPHQNSLALFWWRLRLMLLAIVVPELMVGLACRQFLDAWWFSKKTQLELHPHYYIPFIRGIEIEDIKDRSKGDSISKGVALIQGLWFMTQSLARFHQGIAVTELEVATLAFQFVTMFVWFLWWKKPLDVHQPILIGIGPVSVQLTPPQHADLLEMVSAFFLGAFPDFDPDSSTSVPSFWSTHGTHKEDSHLISIIIQTTVGAVFSAIHCAAWTVDFSSTIELWMWRICSVVIAVLSFSLTVVYVPMVKLKVSAEWAWKALDVTFLIAIVFYIMA
ncbi:hypothetical protein MVEN_00432700 [Mycena venus]|uniref:Uncharacterized protein n=1 Tax=Mycena venus TaxID=2733690 RepID=A0A8H7DB44_9AGAR|nr:hypothetical protein MVEN_00432700 [Mycena venus]